MQRRERVCLQDCLDSMSEVIVRDFVLLLYSMAAGAGFAFVYDILRLFRRICRHGRIWVDMEDILFWTICFFASFYLLYYVNYGVIRFFLVFGAGIGMLLYDRTVGRVFVKGGYHLFCLIMFPIRFVKNRLTRIANHFTMKLRDKIEREHMKREKKKKKERGESAHARGKDANKNRKKTCISAKKK